MKSTDTLPRSTKRSGSVKPAAPTNGQSSQPTGGPGSTAAPETKEPATPPPVNYAEAFTRHMELIFTGQSTPAAELFEPLQELNILTDEIIGTVTNTKARELFSLAQSLKMQVRQLPLPRKPAQVESWKRNMAILAEQSPQAEDLFWQYAKTEIDPEHNNSSGTINLGANWKLFITRHRSENPFENLFEGGFPMPGSLLAHLMHAGGRRGHHNEGSEG